MTILWTTACAGVAGTTLCLLAADRWRSRAGRVSRRIREATRRMQPVSEPGTALFRDWRVDEDIPRGITGWLRSALSQSGLPVSAGQFGAVSVVAAAGGGAIGAMLIPAWAWTFAVVLGLMPAILIHLVRQRRIEQMRRALPEAFDSMRRAVEAGQSVASAFQMVATHSQGPLAAEFVRCGEQQNLGLAQDAALRELARRVPIIELNIFVIALLVQRQCGGSPVEILTNMSGLIRKRLRLDGRVQALTAEGRLQAIVLTVLPVAAFAGLVAFRPDYVEPLLQRPKLLALLAAWQLVGTLWVQRTMRLEY